MRCRHSNKLWDNKEGKADFKKEKKKKLIYMSLPAEEIRRKSREVLEENREEET